MVNVALKEGVFDDIFSVTDFDININQANTRCLAARAAEISLPILLGRGQQDGRLYSDSSDIIPAIGVIGCDCSSATKSFAQNAIQFKTSMVSGISTNS